MGCTDCGRKGGCDHRKQGMFAALDELMAGLYPTRRWDERDDAAALDLAGGAPAADDADAVASAVAHRLQTAAMFRPGDPEEWCDYVYVLCLGRTPSILEVREGAAAALEDGGADGLEERYLRVALSSVGRYAGVQEVAMTLKRDGDSLVITESSRSGVFDPVLLPRFQSVVAVLAELDIRHLDFGEIVTAPEGYDPGSYAERYGSEPVIANYLFSPHPPAAVTTVVVAAG